MNLFFKKNEEQIRSSQYQAYTKYINDLIDDTNNRNTDDALKLLNSKKEVFKNIFQMNLNEMMYSPMKPINDAKQHIQAINKDLSFGSVGMKLKKIAQLR